jgi:hypothetical protein
MDYQKALAQVKSARNGYKKPIGNNTWLILNSDNSVAIRLHQTDILTYRPDGSIILDTGGWETVTTKARMNEYLDCPRVGSDRGVWVISSGGIEYFFERGMAINPDGTIDGQPTFAEKLGKIIGKTIETYDALIEAIKALSIEELVEVWKRCKFNRVLLARHCRPDFLPLTIGSQSNGWRTEPWQQIVSERLRAA